MATPTDLALMEDSCPISLNTQEEILDAQGTPVALKYGHKVQLFDFESLKDAYERAQVNPVTLEPIGPEQCFRLPAADAESKLEQPESSSEESES